MEKAVLKILEEMRDQYRGKSFDFISSLNWEVHKPIRIGWRKYQPSVWSQEYGINEVVLVVQLTKWYIPNIFGTTDCIGFLQNQNNETTDVDAYWLMHEIGHP
jgi:hypothetical protein